MFENSLIANISNEDYCNWGSLMPNEENPSDHAMVIS